MRDLFRPAEKECEDVEALLEMMSETQQGLMD
jgi:hypothetical protein